MPAKVIMKIFTLIIKRKRRPPRIFSREIENKVSTYFLARILMTAFS